MQNITTLLFDFGGTLAYVHPSHDWLYRKACLEFGVDGDPARLRKADEGGWDAYQTPRGPAHPQISTSSEVFARYKRVVLQERLRQSGVTGPLEAIAARIFELDTLPDMYRVFEDVGPTLQVLRDAGYHMSIISNHEWDLPDLVTGLGLAGYFDAVVTSARSGYRKPHPLAYQHALNKLAVAPQDALMVGDDPQADVQGAQGVGIKAVLLDREGRHTSAKGASLIRSLSELPGLL